MGVRVLRADLLIWILRNCWNVYGLLIFLSLIIIMCICACNPVQVWLYSHSLPCVCDKKHDSNKEYDAFVLYCPNESSLVWEYVRELENGKRKFKFRYWRPEDTTNITFSAMNDSKEIIVLLTDQYIQSEYCLRNFLLAVKATKLDKKKELIVIKYPGLRNIEDYNKNLNIKLFNCTCIQREDKNFWNTLLYALPHRTKHDDNKLNRITDV